MSGHQSAAAVTVEWLTPPEILAALGEFDLDPCAPIARPWPTAARHYTAADNGLLLPWEGRVWMNPPYSEAQIKRWMQRMAEHDHGTALIFARTETDLFFSTVWEHARAVLFLRGRLHFHFPDGSRARFNAGAPSVLVAYGDADADMLAYCDLDGQFVPLRLRRSAIVTALDAAGETTTWREVVAALLQERDGPVELAELYRCISAHPKAKANPHFRAKVRQTLQRGAGRRVDRGLWQGTLI